MRIWKTSHFLLIFGVSLLLIASILNTPLTENQILLKNESTNEPSAQMNYIQEQLNLDPYVWDTLGFTGDSNSSIAIIGSGIDYTHSKFGYDSYGDKDFTKKIVGWKDYVNISNSVPIDPNGLSTFSAASAFGNNDSESLISLDSENRVRISLGSNYLQTKLFPTNPGPGEFEIKLGSFLVDQDYANITLNASYQEYTANFIQDSSFQIRKGGSAVNETTGDVHGIYRQLTYKTNTEPSIYDFYFRYYIDFSKPANFSINALLDIPLENDNDYSGIAPDTKIVGLRVLNEKLEGNVSSIISALNWTKNNRDDYHIVGIQIDLGNYLWDTTASEFSDIIEDVIQSGIMIFLPAGDDSVVMNALNPLVVNELPIVVGAVSDVGKLTYYTSIGETLASAHKKIDILAPGGSYLSEHRTIISADTNDNDAVGYFSDQFVNDSTSMVGSSISSSFVAASYSLLIEALGGYSVWESIRTKNSTLAMKSRLLMTATELNQAREDNPDTNTIDESSNIFSPELNRGEKDSNEGFGLLNIPAALESIVYELSVDGEISKDLVPVTSNSTGIHSFARKIQLTQNEYYNFTLTFTNTSDLDFFLYQNLSDPFGDPEFIQSSTTSGNVNESIVFGLEQETGTYIVVIKAISGDFSNFTLNVTHLTNMHVPTLTDHIVGGIQGFNDTLDTFEFVINYTDQDDLPPITLDLNITGYSELIPFEKVIADLNYTDGCLYEAQFHFYEIGTVEYHIVAWDGLNLVRSPGITNYTLEVLPINNAIYTNYTWNFSTMENWETDGYWNNITQLQAVDPRSTLDDEWSALYFGEIGSISTGDYSYESVPEVSISSAYSPQFWLNESSNPIFQIGARISINNGDLFLINIRSNRTGSWENLDSFTNIESEWSFLEYDLSAYLLSYVQIQFWIFTDVTDDIELNKGVLLSDFSFLHQPLGNLNSTVIFNGTITPETGAVYQNYRFSTIVGDADGELPDVVYLEIDHSNYTMFNIYGDFDSAYVLDNGSLQSGGITYIYDINFATISNSSYRFHAQNNGDFTSTEFFLGPEIDFSTLNSTFPYHGNPSSMSVYGNPQPLPETLWVSSSNSFHYIDRDNVWYSGENYYQGYGDNWDVYLVSSLIHIPPSNVETDRVYLWFEHQLIFDSIFPELLSEDYAQIMISSDYGDHWYELEVYEENVNEYTAQKIDLWNYKGMDVLIRFEFHSDDAGTLPDLLTGWYIRNIMVNVDESLDKEPPTVIFTNLTPNMIINETFTLEITILDPSGIDDDLVTVYINTVSIDGIVSENGIIIYDLDTTQFRNGNTTISVIAYDTVGNQVIESTYITIQNESQVMTWVYVIGTVSLLLIGALLFLYFKMYKPAQRKKELSLEMLSEEDKQRLLAEQRARELEVLRIREEAELATPESEALKPFTYKCNRCSKEFENKDYIWSMMCPDCDTDTLQLMYQCKICNRIFYFDTPGEYFCNDCDIKLLK